MIAPHEFKNKSFNKSVRGYNISEVDEYIEFLIDKYTEAYKKAIDLENELHRTNVKYSELHNDEESIRAVIIKAQKLGESIVQQAKNEAAKIIDGVKAECQAKIDEAEGKIEESKREIEKIRSVAESYRSGLYNQYIEHIKMLQAMDFSFPISDGDSLSDSVNDMIDKETDRAKGEISNRSSSAE